MLSVMLTMGTLFQGFVVAFLILLNQPFEADVSADFKSEMIALEEHQEARYPTVTVPKWMDAQKIQAASGA